MTKQSHACHCSNEFCNADNTLKLLEAERDELRGRIKAWTEQDARHLKYEDELIAERDALRERVERLEAGLKEIAENYTEETDYEYLGMKKLMDIAKAALSIPEGER